MNVQEISLDVTKKPSTLQMVYLGQGDRGGTTLRCHVYDDGGALALGGMTAKLKMRKPKGAGYYTCQGSVSGNVATFAIDESSACTQAGTTDVAYVEITSGSARTSTNRFRVVVLESAEG